MKNIDKIARRLTKTRSLSSIEHRRASQPMTKIRIKSDSSAMLWRRQSSDNVLALEDGSISDKIKQWLTSSNEELKEFQHQRSRSSTKNSNDAFTPIEESDEDKSSETRTSRSSTQNGLEIQETGNIRDELLKEVINSGAMLENVTWEIKECDVLLKVDDVMFPVKKDFVSYVSVYFQHIFEKEKEENILVYTLDGYYENEIRSVLNFIYSVEEEKISDENVAAYLQLATEFGVSRLRFQCENHLQTSDTFNPFIALHLSKQYNLETLYDHSLKEISKMENIENTVEFDALDLETQNQILKYILKRYQKASRTLSQFDVHLCNHHGNDPKNNTCCFRAATYNTENDRIFLVKMENPEKKLVESFEKSFNVDSNYLDHDSS